ncbi:G-type lectin S-receptor-like serine/threonine-protein kinase [Quillaja saponaria]|nr:G-type lectin S-receptor-like serine/threonine-protein kinase [Quillaja saponaria]
MKIMNHGGETLSLYSPAQPIRNTVANLLDSGNFIMQEVNSNGSMKRLLWQSFDHPTATLLPGMKLGVNHKTGRSWSLVSWHAYSIPGWVLDIDGQMRDQGGGDLAKVDNCYGFDTDGRRQRWEQPTCRHHDEIFEFMSGYFDHAIDSDSHSTRCIFYNGKWKSVSLASGTAFAILVSSHSDKKDKKKWIWIGSSLATILLIICLCILCLILKTQNVVLKGLGISERWFGTRLDRSKTKQFLHQSPNVTMH